MREIEKNGAYEGECEKTGEQQTQLKAEERDSKPRQGQSPAERTRLWKIGDIGWEWYESTRNDTRSDGDGRQRSRSDGSEVFRTTKTDEKWIGQMRRRATDGEGQQFNARRSMEEPQPRKRRDMSSQPHDEDRDGTWAPWRRKGQNETERETDSRNHPRQRHKSDTTGIGSAFNSRYPM